MQTACQPAEHTIIPPSGYARALGARRQPLFAQTQPIERALISVYDKRGLIELCRGLETLRCDILASHGTAEALRRVDIAVTSVDTFTQSQDTLDGRVKTLHPKLHAGILADRRRASHMRDLRALDALPIDLVICNLYPFAARSAAGESRSALLEHIDIGGPALLRAAAKNIDAGVVVLCDIDDYRRFLKAIKQFGRIPDALRTQWAAKAFRKVAEYDLAIANWYEAPNQQNSIHTSLPETLGGFRQVQSLAYGPNPKQIAAVYQVANETGIAHSTRLQGQPLSYNAMLDADTAYRTVYMMPRSGCVISKHMSLCGMAVAAQQNTAFERALNINKTAAVGSVVAFNAPVTIDTVQALWAANIQIAAIVAPSFSAKALTSLQVVPKLCLLQAPPGDPHPPLDGHRIGGGLLVTTQQHPTFQAAHLNCVTRVQPNPQQQGDLELAMQAAYMLKSNAAAVVSGATLVGMSAGFTTRLHALTEALAHAGARAHGGVLASDGRFSSDACVQLAADYGIATIVQPAGGTQQSQCIAAANAHGIAMVLTHERMLKH